MMDGSEEIVLDVPQNRERIICVGVSALQQVLGPIGIERAIERLSPEDAVVRVIAELTGQSIVLHESGRADESEYLRDVGVLVLLANEALEARATMAAVRH